MPTLILIRHANAELASPGMRDFDRPLSKQGWEEGATSGAIVNQLGYNISKVFCSPARRTSETLIVLRRFIAIDDLAIEFPIALYEGDVSVYEHILTGLDENDVCVCVGHNPMVENFAFLLAANGNEKALEPLKAGFPTAAVAVFELNGPATKITSFFSPK